MAYEDGVNMNMPVAPAYGGSGMDGFGNGWWIILLILCLNNGLWGGFGGNGGGANGLYPWLNQESQMNAGFQNQMLQSSISSIIGSITGGFADVQNALCSGFASVTAAVVAGQNAISQQLYSSELANLERSFAAQTAQAQQMNALQAQFAQCCCDQKAATADLKYTLATEACNSRAATAEAMQKILDVMCQDRLAAKDDRIADLERQLTLAQFYASQNSQTAAIVANNEAQTVALERYLAPVPTPAYIVQNPNCPNGGLY